MNPSGAPRMKAVILAAGRGTRMGGLTDDIPKPMLRVQGKPILEHILEGLREAGVEEFCIITGWKADVVERHMGDGSRWNVRINYARQQVQDGTGKAPELAKDFVSGAPFFLTYGDILVKPDTYRRMVERYREGAHAGVVTITGSEDVTKGGLFFFDDQFRLSHLVEKPSAQEVESLRQSGWLKPGATAWYNAGIYIFEPSLFDHTAKLVKSPRGEYELTDAIAAMVAQGHNLAGLVIEGRWVDVRDPQTLAALQNES